MKPKLIPIMTLLLALMTLHCGGAEPPELTSNTSATADAGPSAAKARPTPSQKVQTTQISLSANWPNVPLPQDYDTGVSAASQVCGLTYGRFHAQSPNTKAWLDTGADGNLAGHVRGGATVYPNPPDEVIIAWTCAPVTAFGTSPPHNLWTHEILPMFSSAGGTTLLGSYTSAEQLHATMVGMGGASTAENSLFVDGSGYWEQSAGLTNYGPQHEAFEGNVQWQVLGTDGSFHFASCEIDGAGGTCTLPDETLTPSNSFCSFDQQTMGNIINSFVEIDGSSGQWVMTAQTPTGMLNGEAMARMECIGYQL